MKQPFSYCTRCSYCGDSELINKSCPEAGCRGVIRSALREGDWQECSDCGTTGRSNEQQCSSCKGYGWILQRPVGVQ